jgi:hypothetical protein
VTELLFAVASVLVVALVAWVIPAWTMKRLVPVLERSPRLLPNFRGRRIPTGLGLVWLVWAAGVVLVASVVQHAAYALQSGPNATLGLLFFLTPLNIVSAIPMALVLGALGFGLVDDIFGSGEEKGFRGHVRALGAGRLTTGGLKLLGIGILALAAAGGPAAAEAGLGPGFTAADPLRALIAFAGWVCAALVIALAANLVNLTDLRPGRALKAYFLLATVGLVVMAWAVVPAMAVDIPTARGLGGWVTAIGWLLGLSVLILGPVFAVWRYDLGERAMLGDAGANAMGALAGFLLVARSPLWLDAVFLVILLALNLASERVSFSAVIEKTAFLRWIDRLGRLDDEPEQGTAGDTARRQGGGTDDPGAGVTDADDGRDGGS